MDRVHPVMRIDPAGWPFVLASAAVGALGFLLGGPWWSLPGAAGALVCLFFFRDPERTIAAAPDVVLSPADGRVMVAGAPIGGNVPVGEWQQVSIFLSPLDVHVNRIPFTGQVTHVEYHPGAFLPAYRKEAGELNEYTEVWLDRGDLRVVVRQIVGLLARRIVCRATVGASVTAGDRYGVMKFGSRMDIFIPVSARLRIAVGDRVVAGVTVVASLGQQGQKP
jgi:phosphatidylserine decarboxylase